MDSKNWKVWLVASLSAVLMSACAKDKDHHEEERSPYAGVWANAEAARLYAEFGGDTDSFCRKVYENDDLHVRSYSEKDYRLNSILVNTRGEVFRYSMEQNYDSKEARARNYRGAVNASGQFTDGDRYGTTRRNRYDLPVKAYFQFDRNDRNRLWIGSTQAGGGFWYVRMTDADMRDYKIKLDQCYYTVVEKRTTEEYERRETVVRGSEVEGREGAPVEPRRDAPPPREYKR